MSSLNQCCRSLQKSILLFWLTADLTIKCGLNWSHIKLEATCYYLDWDSKFSSYSLYLYRLCRKILLKPFCSESIGNILRKDPLILRYSTDFNFYKDRKGEWPCASHTVDATSHFERMRDPEFSNTFGKPNWACLYIAVYTSSLSSTETLGRNW